MDEVIGAIKFGAVSLSCFAAAATMVTGGVIYTCRSIATLKRHFPSTLGHKKFVREFSQLTPK